MVSRLGVPGIYPSGGLLARRLLPSTGSLGSVPPLHGYYSTLRIPSTRPAALRCLRLAVSRSHPLFAPVAAECNRPRAWSWSPGTSGRELPRRRRGLPGSWRTLVNVPCSPTPAGPRAPGHCGAAARPSVPMTTSAPANFFISGLNRTARSLAVYASQPGLPRHHARLASGCRPGSAGRDWLPAGSHRKVSALQCIPLSQAFPGAPSGEV